MSDDSIVHVTLWHSPYLGNFMSSEIALARAVREQFGLSSHFVLGPGGEPPGWLGELERAGVTWSTLPARHRDWRSHLDQVVAEHSAPLVHTHFTAADLSGAAAARAARIPCVWHFHTGFDGYPLSRRLTDVIKMRLVARRRVARIVAVSQWLADFAVRRGAPRDIVEVIPNAIASERFEQLPSRASARERFGLRADAQVILAFGWWPEAKGVDVLIDAVGRLGEQREAPSLLLVGEERMRAFLAQHHPQPPSWLHAEGFVSDAAWLFAAADVFVSASRHEGHAAAIGEAAACGLPVVMSDIEGTSGWAAAPYISTFAREDAGALAGQLGSLLDLSPQQRAAQGSENREWVHERAGVDAWCARICAIYGSLL